MPPAGRETGRWVQGDYLQFYYYLWLVRDRVLSGASILWDPYQFATDGPRLNLPNTFLPLSLLYLPLSLLGPRAAYNALVLLSFPLSGIAAALLARRYGVPRAAAATAGLVFACAPYRVGALLGGHPAGLAYFLVPLALWGLEGALAGSVAGGLWCAVALAATAIVEPHFFYFAALGLPLYLVARLGLPGWSPAMLRVGAGWWLAALAVAAAPAWGALAAHAGAGWRPPGGARLVLGAALAAGVLALWQCAAGGLRAAGVVGDARAAARRSLLATLPWLLTAAAGTRGGAPVALGAAAVPPLIHAAWLARAWPRRPAPLALAAAGALAGAGFLLAVRQLLLAHAAAGRGRTLHEALLFSPTLDDLLARVNPSAGRAIYPGAVALVLALAGLVGLIRRPPPPRARVLFAFGPLVALALLLSLGPRLTAIPLFEAAFRGLPGFGFIRQPAKFQVLAHVGLAVLAAVGAATVARAVRRPGAAAVLAVGLGLLAAAEYHPGRPAGLSVLPGAGAAFDTIRAIGPRALYVPLWPGDSSYSALHLYATTLTRVPMINGYSAFIDRAYVADVYGALEAVNVGVVGAAEHAVLRRLGVRQLVLDPDAFPLKVSPFGPALTLAGLSRSPALEPAGGDGPLRVFRVRERPDGPAGPPPTSPLGVYWEAESLRRETGRPEPDPRASNGRVIAAEAGRDAPGFLAFGPYRLLPPGAYRAVFRVRGRGSAIQVQVTADRGTRVLGGREALLGDPDAFGEVVVPFALAAATAVEYRVRWDGRGQAAFDAVAVAFAAEPEPATTIEVEALGHELVEAADPEASAGRAARADPALAPRDRLWSGPLRRYPAGAHRLWIRLKVERPGAGPLAWCGAQAASAGPIRGGRELAAREVPEAGRYVELAVDFALDRPEVLEFPCAYRGGSAIWFDRLRIEGPPPGPGR